MNVKKKFIFKWKSILTLVIMGLIIYNFGEQVIKTYQVQKEVNVLEAKINETKEKNQQLKRTVENLNTDAYVEKVAREKIGLVKKGETVILKAKDGTSATADTNSLP